MTRQFSKALEELISLEEGKLVKLKRLQNFLYKTSDSEHETEPETSKTIDNNNYSSNFNFNSDQLMTNPVKAFLTLNRLTKALDAVHELIDGHLLETLDGNLKQEANYGQELRTLLNSLRRKLPSNDDLIGSGQALLRLQIFYNLKIDKLVEGRLADNIPDGSSLRMQPIDCFELGKIAFNYELYALTIQWHYKVLEMMTVKGSDIEMNLFEGDDAALDDDQRMMINEILDHMAFAAYKLDLLDYSILLTEAWLKRDPDNDRAVENLEYYLEEVEWRERDRRDVEELANVTIFKEQIPTTASLKDIAKEVEAQEYSLDENFNLEEYSIANDRVVRKLCQSSGMTTETNYKCHKRTVIGMPNDMPFFDVKLETLNERPLIMRIHEIISRREALHVRNEALPRLQRSTVNSGDSLQTSNFRIAKTAWISSERDSVAERIERRLGEILNIEMGQSEDLQVVNYGLGGFYGPHLDSARSTKANNKTFSDETDSVPISDLQRNDRLATILIYLNQVEAGGATVFPRLNVTLAPIERSAVVWFNIMEDGRTDEMTLHTGCPVLLGSKWIATKWPREQANTFARPCRLRTGK